MTAINVRRIGMIGCGHIGTVHGYALHQLAEAGLVRARLSAAHDSDEARAQRFAQRFGTTVAPSVDGLLDEVDAVWVCTWTAEHLDAVRAAADRGLPVFCEKPLGPTYADCEAVATELERVPHQVGLVLRWSPVFEELAAILAEQRYGRVLTTILRDDQFFPVQGYYGSTWRADVRAAGGGTLIEHSIHDVDVLRWLLGDAESVAGRTNTAYGHEGIEDLASVTLGFASGATAQLVSVWHQILSRGSSRRLEVFCDDAYLWTEDDHLGPLWIETAEGTTQWEGTVPSWASRLAVPEVYEKAIAHYAAPSKHFLDALDRDGSAAQGHPVAADALAAHRVVELAYRSARSGGRPQPTGPEAFS